MTTWYIIDGDLPFLEEFPQLYQIDDAPSALWKIIDGDLPFKYSFPQMHSIDDAPDSLWKIVDGELPFKSLFPKMYRIGEDDSKPPHSSFTFKEINSSEFGKVEVLPLCLRHEERTDFINFVSGSPYVRETTALRSKVITITLGLKDTSPENIDKINSWLIGTGKLIFSHDPDRYYIATCNNALTGRRVLSLGKLPIQFNVMPYKYDNNESNEFESVRLVEATVSQGATIQYEGNAPSESAFKITGTGDIQIYSVQSDDYVEIHGLTGYCVIDLKKRKVTDENDNLILDHTYGNIFDLKLVPGQNIFLISGDVTALAVKKRTRWY